MMSCSTSCVADVTVEGDLIDFKCQLEYFGASEPELTWRNKLDDAELNLIPLQKRQDSIFSRDFTGTAVAPALAPLVCLAKIPNAKQVTCETQQCNILCKYVC